MEKRLFRSRRDKMIAGVCGGMGEYFKIDPVIVRLIFVILAFINAIGLIAYILLWIIVPPEGREKPTKEVVKENIEEIAQEAQKLGQEVSERVKSPDERKSAIWFGVGLVILGILLILGNYNVIYWTSLGKMWPALLMLLGIYLILKK